MSRSTTRLAVFAIAAVSVAACGPGSTAKAVRPSNQSAGGALDESSGFQCTSAPRKGEPLVVDWKTKDQLDLTVSMHKGVAVVAYDCKSLRLLKDCSIKGRYGFTAVPSVIQEAVQIDDADEVHASMPLGGAALSGEVKRGSTIDIALAYVGKQAALLNTVGKGDLVGDCEGATHFVRGATLGAFVIATGTKGEVRGAAQIFGAGVGSGSTSSKSRLNAGGDVNACKGIKDGADKAPDGCSAVVRLELLAIGADAGQSATPKVLENTCPDGYVPANGHCVNKKDGSARRCDATNVAECKQQCEKGSVESCYNAGTALIIGSTVGGPEEKEATPLFEKGCNGNVGDACFWLGQVYRTENGVKALAFAKKGCELFSQYGCSLAGDISGDDKERVSYWRKACDLGLPDGCYKLGKLYLEGRDATAKKTDGLVLLESVCSAGSTLACADLAKIFRDGKLSSKISDISPDPARRLAAAKRYCALKPKGGEGVKCPPEDDGATASTAPAASPSGAGPSSSEGGSKMLFACRDAKLGTATVVESGGRITVKAGRASASCDADGTPKANQPRKLACDTVGPDGVPESKKHAFTLIARSNAKTYDQVSGTFDGKHAFSCAAGR